MDIDKKIVEAMKSHDEVALRTYRLIKTEFVNAVKNGITIDNAVEIKLINKMIAQHKDSIAQYKAGNRADLASNEAEELKILQTLVPAEPTEEEITACTINCINEFRTSHLSENEQLNMKHMKQILSMVQLEYPTASGKLVSSILKSRI